MSGFGNSGWQVQSLCGQQLGLDHSPGPGQRTDLCPRLPEPAAHRCVIVHRQPAWLLSQQQYSVNLLSTVLPLCLPLQSIVFQSIASPSWLVITGYMCMVVNAVPSYLVSL